ncbi:MAG: site-2 protease family protein [Clostridia bacterium]|nr:site-2 protease family protein [Clostridia bacterium]
MLSNWISLFRANPTEGLVTVLIQVPALLLALILHEISHGYVALWCGDPTAKMLGRLSLNPSAHLDPLGSLCMVLFGFGWAKPVPVNPRNFRSYVRDDVFVSLAGVTMNFLLFLVSSFLMVLTLMRAQAQWLIYPYRFFQTFASINLSLAFFNLLPIPPLDGYHVVNDIVLKGRFHPTREMLIGFQIALLALLYGTNIITNLLSTVTGFFWSNVVGFYMRLLA